MQFKNPLLASFNSNLGPYKDIQIRGAWESDSEEDEYWDDDKDTGPNWLTFCKFFIDINNSGQWIYQVFDSNILDNWFHEFDGKQALEFSQAFLSLKNAAGIDGFGDYLAHAKVYPDFEKEPADSGARISPRVANSLTSIEVGAKTIQEKQWNYYTGYDWIHQKNQKYPLVVESKIHPNHIVLVLTSKYNSTFEVTAEIYKNALGKETIKLTTNLLFGTRPLETADPRYLRSLEELQLRSVLASLFRHAEILHTWIGNKWPEPEGLDYYLSEDKRNAWISRWDEFKIIPGRNSAFATSSGHEEFLNFIESGEIPVIDAPRPYLSIKTNEAPVANSHLCESKKTTQNGYPQIIQFGHTIPFDSHEKFIEQLSGSLHVIKTAADIVEDGFRNQRIMPTLDSDIVFGFLDFFHHRSNGAALFDSIFNSESSVKGKYSAELSSYSRWIPQTLAEVGVGATRKNLEKGLKAKRKWKRRRLLEWVVTDGVDPESVVVAINRIVEEYLIPTKDLKKALELLNVAIGMRVANESDRANSLKDLITK